MELAGVGFLLPGNVVQRFGWVTRGAVVCCWMWLAGQALIHAPRHRGKVLFVVFMRRSTGWICTWLDAFVSAHAVVPSMWYFLLNRVPKGVLQLQYGGLLRES